MQLLDAPELILVGLHAKPVTSMGATKLRVALWEEPFNEAATVALWEVARVPAVAVNAAEVAPPDTVTDAGTVRAVLLLETAIATAKGAAWFSVAVQVEELPEVSEVGLQASPDKSSTETTPPVPFIAIA